MPSQPKEYSVEVDGPEVAGEGKPRRNVLAKELIATYRPNVTTLWENFVETVKQHGNEPCFGTRKGAPRPGSKGPSFVWKTYNEIFERIKKVGSALANRGIVGNKSVGLFAVNREEWVIAEQACYMFANVTVPLYDTLGKEAVEFIVKQANVEICFASNDKIKILVESLPQTPSLKTIVLFNALSEADLKELSKVEGKVQYLSFDDFEKEGAEKPVEAQPCKPEDLCTICYTSGTTGLPKGAMLTHANVVADISGMTFLGDNGAFLKFGPEDVHLSYLPLAHVFERVVMGAILGWGARVGFYQGDATKLLDDIGELRPTIFPSVPRILNRIYDRVFAGVKSKGGVAEMLFNKAYAAKKANLKHGVYTHWLWDRVVFAKVRNLLGGRCRALLSGASPISGDVLDFMRIVFSCPAMEGFGQTETCAGASITWAEDCSSGHVGAPVPCNEIKLVDVPDMNYTSKDQPYPRGEICFKGYNVMKGYFMDDEKTKEAIDEKGWLHSGDIGMWDEKGRLKIIDRKKNIFKLAQGEYIAPEKIENVYIKHELVAQAFVHGDSLQAVLVAVIVPDEDILKRWAKSAGITFDETKVLADLCGRPEVNKHILGELTKFGKANDLKGFECVKAIHLESEPFSAQNDLLSPTFKLKRPQAAKLYKPQIDSMYAALNAAQKPE